MAFELAAYGFISGWLYQKLPRRKGYVYITLLAAMVIGRLVSGIVMFVCMGLDTAKYGFRAFLTGSVLNAIPGIVLQLILVPVIAIRTARENKH